MSPRAAEFAFDLLDGGQRSLQRFGQRLDELVLGDNLVLVLTQQQSDGLAIGRWVTHLAIDCGQVEAELAEVLGLELLGLQFDDDVSMELDLVEQQSRGGRRC